MLQKLRDQTQSLFFKIVVGAIIFVLAIFGFGAFNLFLTTDPTVASVNGEDITQNQLAVESEREQRRMAAQFGENFDPSMIDPVLLQNSVINQLITRTLLGQAAEDLGIGVSDKQVNTVLISNPSFHLDDRFDEGVYRRVVNMLGYSPTEFLELTGRLIGIEQLRSGVTETAFTTDWELREHARLLSQRRDLAYLAFTEAAFADGVEVSEEDVAIRYEENLLDYMTEESVDVAYVELTLDALSRDPSITVSEEDLLGAYEADRSGAVAEEQRDSRHILLQVNEERSLEAAVSEVEALKARIEAGEAFADLAREVSEDPGSAAAGGDLGPVSKGLFAPEFEAALWTLETGQLSDPVKTEFGVHLIELKGIITNEFPPFEELRPQIEDRLRRDAAAALFIERVREMDNLAFEQPDTLQGISDQLGLEIRTAEGISRSIGSGIFGNVKLRESVFTDEVLEQGYNSPAVEYLENRAVVARITGRHEPEVIPVEEVAADIRSTIVSERARLEIESAHADALARVSAGESVTEVANSFGLEWQTHELVRRNAPGIPPAVLNTAFTMTRPVTEKKVGSAEGAGGERYVVTLTRVEDGDVSTMTEAETDGVRRFLATRSSNLDFESFYSALEQDASIRRPN